MDNVLPSRSVRLRNATRTVALFLLAVVGGCGRFGGGAGVTERAIAGKISGGVALELVEQLAPIPRFAGTDGFDEALDAIKGKLEQGGFAVLPEPPRDGAPPPGAPPAYAFFLSDTLAFDVWEPVSARLEVLGPDGFVAADTRETPMVLAQNSSPTPPGGIITRIINLGNGTFEQEYEGVDVRGAVVYGRQPLADIYRAAVLERGALGAVSPSAFSWHGTDDHPDLVAYGTVGREGFGFKVSPETAYRLEDAMTRGGGSTRVNAVVDVHYLPDRRIRTLIAEIPGSENPLERVAVIAPLSGPAPGAGDVSGAAALVEAAVAIRKAIEDGSLEQPRRGLVFVWGVAISGTMSWASHHTQVVDELHSVTVLHLLGGGGVNARKLLVERMPDPSAVWTRPPDDHTPQGASIPPYWPFEGHYLSDFTEETAVSIAEGRGEWEIGIHPYEGRSDHEYMLMQRIPAQKIWQFPDPLYRSSLDTPAHIDAEMLAAGALVVAVTAYEMALAELSTARWLVTVIYNRGRGRLGMLLEQARENLGVDDEGNPTRGDRFLEQDILNAWKRWYLEAIESVMAHPTAARAPKIRMSVMSAVRSLEKEWDGGMTSMGLVPIPLPERLRTNLEWK